MDTVDGEPTQNIDITALKSGRWSYLSKVIQSFINQFIPTFVEQPITITDQPKQADSCRSHTPANQNKKSRSKDVSQCDQSKSDKEDYVRNYACNVMGHVLLARNFRDAGHESDGARSIRCWNFLSVSYTHLTLPTIYSV